LTKKSEGAFLSPILIFLLIFISVPGSEKHDRDYIVENMQHIRHVSSQTRKAKSKEKLEPMKVKFIPGLT
jgi:hypothetical protein